MLKLFTRSALAAVLVFGAAGIVWGQSSIQVKSSGGLQYLATAQGMTLYYFTKDTKGQSLCTGGCAKYWPPFDATNIPSSGSLKASNFGSITLANGATQTTYDGWPLYTFAGDKKPGDMNGQGFKGVWYVAAVPFYTVMDATSTSLGGTYLVDASGRTLYYFTKDKPGTSVCNGGCAKLWPPYDPSSIVVPSNLKASNFSMITRSDGSQQVAYKGHPLYYFVRDNQRGQATGQGFKKIWWVVDPSKLHAQAAASTAVAKSSGSSW